MIINTNIDSRAYLHSGGTKYYRLAAVTVVVDGKAVHALLTNSGPFKPEKGELSAHKPMHGGTSSIEYFSNRTSLENKLNSEAIRRTRSRGYKEWEELRHQATEYGVSELELQNALRGKVGMIAAHYDEILGETGLREPGAASPAKVPFDDLIASAKKGMEDKHGIKSDGTRVPPKRATKAPPEPPAPKVEIDRGEVWGSW